jgi:hypothetical protein
VTAAPSFQQVVKLKEVPPSISAQLLRNSPLLVIPTKRLSDSGQRNVKTAVLSNGSHILLTPPVGTLNPREPLNEGEEIEVRVEGVPKTEKLTVGKLIYFDVRILNK